MDDGGKSQAGPDATDVWWSYVASRGVVCSRTRSLVERLEVDFRAADGGYAALHALPMPQRAVVSDQIVGATQAIVRNLIEARLSQEDMAELLQGGATLDDPTHDAQARDTREDMAFVGFFRGIGSALDNLAAATIGVLRLPRSIRRASFSVILKLNESTVEEHARWRELRDLVHRHVDDPAGWLMWTLEMRNALMHRPRMMTLSLPRPTRMPPLTLPESVCKHLMRERARWDPPFRRRPWLPDMQHLADPFLGSLTEAVLGETAVQTSTAVFEHTNALIEDAAGFLLDSWSDASVIALDPPAGAWALEEPLDIDFSGFASLPFPSDLAGAAISPHDEERVRLAAELHNAGRRSGS